MGALTEQFSPPPVAIQSLAAFVGHVMEELNRHPIVIRTINNEIFVSREVNFPPTDRPINSNLLSCMYDVVDKIVEGNGLKKPVSDRIVLPYEFQPGEFKTTGSRGNDYCASFGVIARGTTHDLQHALVLPEETNLLQICEAAIKEYVARYTERTGKIPEPSAFL